MKISKNKKGTEVKEIKKPKMNRFWAIIIYTTLIAWTAFSIFSLIWIIFTSIRTNQELYA